MNDLDKQAGEAPAEMLKGEGLRFGIVVSRYNQGICDRLLQGAVQSLTEHGVSREDIHVARVPGAWELPLALSWLSRSTTVDGLIALGVVIRGGTPHFEFVCQGCADGCERLSREIDIPIGFGLLTCDTSEQAVERAGGSEGNKGEEAALAALEMANLKRFWVTPVIGHL